VLTQDQKKNNGQSLIATAGEYLTFSLGPEEYGMEILKVQEIRGYDNVTPIANTPEFIKGVINLRGAIVPILDLRIKFRQPRVEYNDMTVVIILNYDHRTLGVVVDRVCDVLALEPQNIRPMPELISNVETRYLAGLGAVDDRMLLLVDIARLMTDREMALVDVPEPILN
jgi:purine-binding chemotaxis protein CheW